MMDAIPNAMQALMSGDAATVSLPDFDTLIDQWNQKKGEPAIDADALRDMAKDPAMAAKIIAAQKAVFSYVDTLASMLAKQLSVDPPEEPDAKSPEIPDMQSLARRSHEKAKQARARKAYAKSVVIAGIINFGNKDWKIDEPFIGWTAEQNPSLPLALLMLGPLKLPPENSQQASAS